MNLKWDHVHLRSPDPEATAQWFEQMLGAQVIRTMQQGKPRIDMKIGGADVFIAPVLPDGKTNPPPVTPYQGLDHFGQDLHGRPDAIELPRSVMYTFWLPTSAPLSRMFFVSSGERNCPFFTPTAFPVRAAAAMRSVCRQRNAGICRMSSTSAAGSACQGS